MNPKYTWVVKLDHLSFFAEEATLNVEIQIYSKQKEGSIETVNKMNPLTVIYWTRVLLGVVAALISTFLSGLSPDFNLLNGISIALLVYIITYYVYKSQFLAKVEKPTKIFMTGVGAYFLSWLVMWFLFYTLFIPR